MKIHRFLLIFNLLIFEFCGSTQNSWAATIDAASCSQADVQNAVNAASAGDTVIIPGGNCSWNTPVVIGGKDITLQGQGVGSTVITAVNNAISLSTNSRITGIEIHVAENKHGIFIDGGKTWRIDHCKFTTAASLAQVAIIIYPGGVTRPTEASGVIDSNYFYKTRIVNYADVCDDTMVNAADLGLGTEEAVYVENNTWEMVTNTNAIDGNCGNKTVVRYNDWNGTSGYLLEQHSIQGNYNIATKKFEFYNNKLAMTGASAWVASYLRGGTGVIFNNVVTGNLNLCGIALDTDRGFRGRGTLGYFGRCDGSAAADGNQTAPNGTGTHTGADGSAVLMDSGKNWIVNDFSYTPSREQTGTNGTTGKHTSTSANGTVLTDSTKTWGTGALGLQGLWIQNTTDGSGGLIISNTATTVTVNALTGGADNTWELNDNFIITGGAYVYNLTDGSKGQIRSNTVNTVTATLTGGATNVWHTGDAYKITFGYPCRGQIGRGKDSGVWSGPPPAVYPTQELVAVYAWGNTCNGAELNFFVSGDGLNKKQIIENRDFYYASSLTDAKSKGLTADYQPYACPHPITGLTGTCDQNIAGRSGYNVGQDTTPPSPPTGLIVN